MEPGYNQPYKVENYSNVLPGYCHKIDTYYSDKGKGLEHLLIQENATDSPVTALFSDKSKTLKATVKELFDEIDRRKKLNSSLLGKINNEMCDNKTYLFEVEDVVNRRYESEDMKFGRRRTQIEQRLLTLEQEKRKEYLEYWRDMMFLKKYLMGALADYWELEKKVQCLKDGMQDENSD